MKLSTTFLLIGVVLAVMGLLALANPFAASLAVTSLVGVVFMVSGVAQAWVEFQAGPHQGRRRNALVALLTIVAAVWLLANPLSGTLSLTLLLGAIFFVMGFVRLAMAASLRGAPFFWLVLLSGGASLAIGLLVLFDVGAAATTFLGLLLGIQLVAEGAGLFAFGLITRHRGF
ncbi:HdeD family acid-resistance protein [Pseudooceanicola sp. 200-1SW]|uniref:HdeD family acid-resistance protein n=1 Tax=Pseudooceanicola sp. 200-1SW TaxID=3425949 RepID=UPI003D7F897B